MPIIQLLYLQSLINEKLHKEKNCLRNIVGHIALSKRLQLIQTEDDLERLSREVFSEPQCWGAEMREICDYISEKLATLTLNDSRTGLLEAAQFDLSSDSKAIEDLASLENACKNISVKVMRLSFAAKLRRPQAPEE